MTIHNGDLAKYTGRVKELRGRTCEVEERMPCRVRVVFYLNTGYARRNVTERNLKKVGGGGYLKTGMRAEG